MKKFVSWKEFTSWLAAQGLFHIRPGLERMRHAMDVLDLHNPPWLAVQVLGTNGKGSTTSFLASLAIENGISTGLYTSPHFLSPRERILIDGKKVPRSLWLDAANEIFAAHCDEPDLSYFEFLTVLAMLVFRRQGVRLAIFEAGLGGKSDATTAIPANLQLFTPIAMDHAAIIGPGIEQIARDKAEAIRSNGLVLSAPQFPICANVLRETCAARSALLRFVDPLPDVWLRKTGLYGQGQLGNAALALSAWRLLATMFNITGGSEDLSHAFIPGRIQSIRLKDANIILDGAHNPHGMQWLLREFGAPNGLETPGAIIYSGLADKDLHSTMAMLCRKFPTVPMFIPQIPNERGSEPDKLADMRKQLLPEACTECFTGSQAFAAALEHAGRIAAGKTVLVAGSLYLLTEFYKLYPQYLNAPVNNDMRKDIMSKPYESVSAWHKYQQEDLLPELYDLASEYMYFLDNCKTERECIAGVRQSLSAAGFSSDFSSKKVMRVLRGKTLFAACKGTVPLENGLNLIAAHVDSPRLDLKQRPLVEQAGIAQAKTHYYGGIRKYQWLARPLALHGVIVLQNGEQLQISIGEDPREPVFCVADLLPHLAQQQATKKLSEAFEGEKLNLVIGNRPVTVDPDDKNAPQNPVKQHILNYLQGKYGICEEDFISAELEAVPAGESRFVGFDGSMVGAYGQDDRISVFCALEAFLAALERQPEQNMALIFWDKEEIGSNGATGASSRFLSYCLEDLAEAWQPGLKASRLLLQTRAISADVTAALDPDYQDMHEKQNAALLGHGPCFSKYTGSRGKYDANDADAEFYASLRILLNRAGIPWQAAELGRVDTGGGGTVAMFLAALGMNVIDLGPALLSMHSPFELSSIADIYASKQAYCEFLLKSRPLPE